MSDLIFCSAWNAIFWKRKDVLNVLHLKCGFFTPSVDYHLQAFILAETHPGKVIIYEDLLPNEFKFCTVLWLTWLLPILICPLACYYWHYLTASVNDPGNQNCYRNWRVYCTLWTNCWSVPGWCSFPPGGRWKHKPGFSYAIFNNNWGVLYITFPNLRSNSQAVFQQCVLLTIKAQTPFTRKARFSLCVKLHRSSMAPDSKIG